MKIGIIGGNGFIGKYLVARLHNEHDISLFTRQAHLDPAFEHINHLTAFCKLNYEQNELNELLANHDVIINLVGILNEKGRDGSGFHKAHVELSDKITQACQHNNIPRYLHMSALHADAENAPSHYQRSKGIAENLVHNKHSASFAVTSFRPSVIFGAGDSFCNRFSQLLKLVPLAFPLACANARFAPIYAGEVADSFISALTDIKTYNQRIDLCGPEIFSLREIVTLTADQLGKKRVIIGLPDSMAYMQAVFMDYCVPGKPFSIDNFNSLKVDSICHSEPSGKIKLNDQLGSYLHLPMHEQVKNIMSV